MKVFSKDFTQQEAIAEEAITRAVEIMQTGKLHRYNVAPGEESEAALLEREFADYMGSRYCLACTSCGMAMFIALKAAGVKSGTKVLCNAFTLAPVPGALHSIGAEVVLVEITDNYTIDLQDLKIKAADPDVHYLLLSHMRGHLVDMEQVVDICKKHDITIIEDCAHTMGAAWNGKKSGTFGKAACFSTQTYKHLNSGEGGFIITDDSELIAKAIINSGSYMLYDRHLSRPEEEVFTKIKKIIPNNSSRLDNLRASILRFQLCKLDEQCKRWNARYLILEQAINAIPSLACPLRSEKELYVGSSIQFSVSQPVEKIHEFLAQAFARGVEIKWFGHKEPVAFTSAYSSWEYLGNLPVLENTDRILATMCDMRIPLTFSLEDCSLIGEILAEVAMEIFV